VQARAPRQSAGSPPAPAASRAPLAPPSPLSPSHSPAARRGAAARTTSRDDRAERPSPSESPPDPDAGPASRSGPTARRPASPSLALLSAFDASLGGATPPAAPRTSSARPWSCRRTWTPCPCRRRTPTQARTAPPCRAARARRRPPRPSGGALRPRAAPRTRPSAGAPAPQPGGTVGLPIKELPSYRQKPALAGRQGRQRVRRP